MAGEIKVKNLDSVSKALDGAISGIKGNVIDGLAVAGEFIKSEAQQLTPVDEGVLRNSAFSKMQTSGPKTFVVVGFTAKYAPAVHEAPMALKGKPRGNFGKTKSGESFGGGSGKGNYWDGGENKFLEKAVTQNLSKIVNIIARLASREPK